MPPTSTYIFHGKRLSKLLCILLFLPLFAIAGNASEAKHKAIADAIESALWQNIQWLNLLHYQKKLGSYVSQVDDERFFYAADGKTDPEAELIESINNLFIETSDHNQQAQCRFIARSQWLMTQLAINRNTLPVVSCDEYQTWRQLIQADSVTMIFPAYHLNSPSSMFGHTLLRLDKSGAAESEWLSYAVNFGANIDNSDNSLLYAYRGLAGGYPGIFITEPYFKKIQEYNRIEHRDIWEYKLNLSAAETSTMIDHLWELKTINFDYYFFDENCSYRLLELLEVARPEVELTDEFILTAIPVDTVRAIEQAGLIETARYRPAQATEIQSALRELPQAQREIVLQLSQDITVIDSEKFGELTTAQQKRTIDLAYRYLRYQNTETSRDPEVAKRSYLLLQQLNSYPKAINIKADISIPLPPEKGHKSKRFTLGPGERRNNQYAQLGFKMAFHDLEDSQHGFLQGAQINIGSLQLRAEEDVGLRLYKFDLVDIFSLTPGNMFFNPLSWKVYSGFERELTGNKDQLVYHLTGGAGRTWEILKNHQFYALAILRLEINKQLKNTLEPAIGFSSGLLSHFKNTTARLEFSGEQFEQDVYRLRTQYTQDFVLATNHSIKFFARYQWQDNDVEFSDINLNYQYYF